MSGPSRASGSAKTVAASSNATPCLSRFPLAFFPSHSNTAFQYIQNLGAQGAAACARLLDTTERIVGYKIKKYGIDSERFRTRT